MKQSRIFLALSFLFLSALLFGQGRGENRDRSDQKRAKMEQMKIAFITQKLDLTSEEAQRFWPVYNEYQKKRQAIRDKDIIKNAFDETGTSVLDDAVEQATEIMGNILKQERELLELKEEYVMKFRGVISDTKILQLLKSERDFKRDIIKSFKGRRDGR